MSVGTPTAITATNIQFTIGETKVYSDVISAVVDEIRLVHVGIGNIGNVALAKLWEDPRTSSVG